MPRAAALAEDASEDRGGEVVSAAASPQLPPGPSVPRAAQTLAWVFRPLSFMQRCRDRYGDSFTLKIAQEGTWVFVSHPDAVKQVFTGDPRLLHAGEANAILLPIVGSDSVLLLDDDAHMRQRKLMLPSFHGERMERYGELMSSIAEQEVARWPVNEPFQLWPRMQAVTLEIIMRTVFGVQQGERLERLRAMLKSTLDWTADPRRMAAMALLGPRRMSAQSWFRRAMDPVDALVIEEIRRRRDDPRLAERDDVLSLLVQASYDDGSPMSDKEVRDELMTLLLAGHETTATSLAWALERLLRHPAKLERLTAEVESGDEAYLDAVVKETLRLRPVLPIVIRRLTEPMEIGGHLLPAGVGVAPCIYLVHRRPDVYPDPYQFRPERFLDTPPGTYTWIPFGGGVRRCLGASFAQFEMKMVLSAIVRRATLRSTRREAERVVRRAITLTPNRGTEVILDNRVPPSARPAAAGAVGVAG
jgi:cytochrome P450